MFNSIKRESTESIRQIMVNPYEIISTKVSILIQMQEKSQHNLEHLQEN